MLKLDMLRAFQAVAETGTLADGAARLGRTPSAVSMVLTRLEAHLGQPLFETDRKNRLTDLGRYVLEQAQTELRQFDATIAAIEIYAGARRGLLRVAAVPSIAGQFFAPAVSRIRARHPRLRIELRDMDSTAVLHTVTRGQAEIGIATPGGALAGMRAVPLLSDAFGLVCAQGHALAGDAPLDLAGIDPAQFAGNDLCRRIEHPALSALLDACPLNAPNTVSLLALIGGGDWVSVLPRSVLGVAPGAFCFRPVRGLAARREVVALARADRRADHVDDFLAILSGIAAGITADPPG